jgi:hypothetical protein
MKQTFRDYLAGKKLPYTAWGDLCRFELAKGTMPNFENWADVRKYVEGLPGLNINIADARSTWHSFRSMQDKATLRGIPLVSGTSAPERTNPDEADSD